MKNNGKPKVVSLFSGCGGMDLGFQQAGYELIWANDFDKSACETYSMNIGEHIRYGDITELDLKKMREVLQRTILMWRGGR